MHLENISLVNFKNYAEAHFSFCPDINCIMGDNGSGKTNLLDAIYYLSLTKSFFNTNDPQNIRFETDFFGIRGSFSKDGKSPSVTCKLQISGKKEILIDDNSYERITDHIGAFPVVMIAPNDTDIIRGSSELRRKFFDGVISQVDRPYLSELLRYNRALKRRNSLLKYFAVQGAFDPDLIGGYDRIIIDSGRNIFEHRKSMIARFNPVFNDCYETMAGKREKVEIDYLSDSAEENFAETFRLNITNDRQNRRTGLGIHKDEFEFLINGISLRKFGSQGQQKSFLIALKLTQFELIRQDKGFKPILLLDDIFDKLDDKRINNLMNLVNRHNFGQLFITDARPERTLAIIHDLDCERTIAYLERN
jgi:DNA replication and repair protein RecF